MRGICRPFPNPDMSGPAVVLRTCGGPHVTCRQACNTPITGHAIICNTLHARLALRSDRGNKWSLLALLVQCIFCNRPSGKTKQAVYVNYVLHSHFYWAIAIWSWAGN